MGDGEFPVRTFTVRDAGYDRDEVDRVVDDLQRELTEIRRALETATTDEGGDTRLHDPEGAVKRTLAIAQETADRVLHDARIEADRRRVDADEHASATIADAEARAAKMLADIELQAAEVREQGVAAARSAIKVERDKAMAELAQVRRVRNDLRAEAVELKSALDRYRHQSREASDTLAAVAAGPLLGVDLPDYVDDEVGLASVISPDDDFVPEPEVVASYEPATTEIADEDPDLDDLFGDDDVETEPSAEPGGLAEVIALDQRSDSALAAPFDDDVDVDTDDYGTDDTASSGGTFLSEVSAASADEDSDRFLSELRDAASDDDVDEELFGGFFDDDD